MGVCWAMFMPTLQHGVCGWMEKAVTWKLNPEHFHSHMSF